MRPALGEVGPWLDEVVGGGCLWGRERPSVAGYCEETRGEEAEDGGRVLRDPDGGSLTQVCSLSPGDSSGSPRTFWKAEIMF